MVLTFIILTLSVISYMCFQNEDERLDKLFTKTNQIEALSSLTCTVKGIEVFVANGSILNMDVMP